jgi:hypothetical protein
MTRAELDAADLSQPELGNNGRGNPGRLDK